VGHTACSPRAGRHQPWSPAPSCLRERIVKEHANCDRAGRKWRSDGVMLYRPEIHGEFCLRIRGDCRSIAHLWVGYPVRGSETGESADRKRSWVGRVSRSGRTRLRQGDRILVGQAERPSSRWMRRRLGSSVLKMKTESADKRMAHDGLTAAAPAPRWSLESV
jgi:hypothetical protein